MTTILTRDTFTAGLIAQGTTTVPDPVNDTDASTKLYADSKGVPVGSSILFMGSASPPTGWLLCNGQAVSRTTYSALYAVIGITYGTGDGSTTFNLPQLKAMYPIGSSFLTKYYVIKY